MTTCEAPLTDFVIDAGTCKRPLGHRGIHWFNDSSDRIAILQPCRVCREKIEIGNEMETHLYTHYNYCKYGHYEEFEVGDSRWPECMAERHDLFPIE